MIKVNLVFCWLEDCVEVYWNDVECVLKVIKKRELIVDLFLFDLLYKV